MPRPKVVTDGDRVVRDARVEVSRADPNADGDGEPREVQVQREDPHWLAGRTVRVRTDLMEAQLAFEARQRAEDRALDEWGLGLYSTDDCHRFPGDPDYRR
jgi:hypothetical protein